MDKAGAAGSPSGNGTNTPPPAQNTPPAQGAGGNGAPIPPPPAQTPPANQGGAGNEPKPGTPPAQQEEDLTGYGTGAPPAEPPKEGEPPKPDDKNTPPAEDVYKDLDYKGLDVEKNKDIVEFAKTHKLSKEQAQAFVDARKLAIDNHAANVAKFENDKKETHARWEKELRDDKDFGGSQENFAANIKLVGDFSKNHLPNLTKALTSNGGRLSSSEMKEIRLLALKMKDEGAPPTDGGAGGNKQENRHPTDYYSN